MKLIAWDTSSKSGALVTMEWKEGDSPRLVSEWTLNVDVTHSERLLWAIDRILTASNWRLSDIDVFGVGVGPGSFTGLRIGVTTARTISHALRKPVVGVSSLAALARPALHFQSLNKKSKTVVIAATDACKGELYAFWGVPRLAMDCVAFAQGDHPGVWKKGVEERVISPENLMQALKEKIGKDGNWMVVGEGRKRYLDFWKMLPADRELEFPEPDQDQIRGRWLGRLVWEGYQAGLAREGLTIHPRYTRASDAEIKLKAGLLKQTGTRRS